MTVRKLAALLIAPLLAAACGDKAQNSGAATGAPQAAASAPAPQAQPDAVRADETSQKALAVAPPKPNEVLEVIYQRDGKGEDPMPIANGGMATYWYGYRFAQNGKHYFTGFAYDTPGKKGKQDDVDLPAPDAKVTLTEATFELNMNAPAPTWSVVVGERYVGESGGYERADAIDDKEAPQSLLMPDGRVVLAVPTWVLAQGTRIKSFSMFVYHPTPSNDLDGRIWAYVGDVARGEDNDAACDANGTGNHIPCVAGSAKLAFAVGGGAGLPALRLTMTGTGIDDAGHKKTYGAADVAEYRFDPKAKAYAAVKK